MVYNGQQIEMKKILIVLSAIAAFLTASAFVTTGKHVSKFDNSPVVVNDNGWEDYTTVTAIAYKKNKDGKWEKGSGALYGTKIQRREWCGTPEYRAEVSSSNYYPVSKSPVKEYMYCFYYDGKAYVFDM